MKTEKAQELNVEILFPTTLVLTWENARQKTGKRQLLLSSQIYDLYAGIHKPGLWTPAPEKISCENAWLIVLGSSDPSISLAPSLDFFRTLGAKFLEKLRKVPNIETIREKTKVECPRKELQALVRQAPPMVGSEYLNLDLLIDLWRAINQTFAEAINAHRGTVGEYLGLLSPHIHLTGRVYFHLVESKDPDYPFQFLATYTLDATSSGKHRPLEWALEEHKDEPKKMLELLTTVHRAAAESPLLKEMIKTGELFHHIAWTTVEAFEFLKQVTHFEHCGILCRIPDWWKQKSAAPSLKISLGTREPSLVGMNAIINVNATLFIGNEPVSADEVRELLAQSQGLALIKNRWIEVDPAKLEGLLSAYTAAMEMADGQDLTIGEALRLSLNPEKLGPIDDLTQVEISNGEWLAEVISKLSNPKSLSETSCGKGFTANLRPYQQQGLNWLSSLDSLGFGACLADDMGLGKTIQILALLSSLKTREPGKTSLLVVPASLISNWENEIHKFLPDLNYYVAHPGYQKQTRAKTTLKSKTKGKVKTKASNTGQTNQPNGWQESDLVITTYAMVQRHKWMADVDWRTLILDEAQAIKNPATKQSRTVKKLRSRTRITMTGTPIENALSDLWSLFDFINPGLLGTAAEFKRFSKALKEDPEGYGRLKQVVSPYILRRMKTDKTIVPDLPDKVEMKTFPQLSKKQQVLYVDFIDELKQRLEACEEGIQRRGLVLSALVKFKQICNHPDQYLGTGAFAPEESGKFIRLGELSETIYAKRERVLVFTQFKEMVAPISAFLETVFHARGCIIHGSLNVKTRQQAIEAFQSRDYLPFMVLSLKAGGTGLNLTQANHVIHFDRWWNPAVENQATDRAFRIGQTRKVLVHKFITRGTIEEKIDLIIEKKKALTDQVIEASDTQGAWLTEMDNSELLELFTLKL